MSKIYNMEQLADRIRDHTTEDDNVPEYNGIELVFVTLEADPAPGFAWLDVKFYNDVIALNDITTSPKPPTDIFKIEGGSRIKGGTEIGQIRVTEIDRGSESDILRLKVEPVGDYSTYTLALDIEGYDIDPIFSKINFKFRPGCFNTNCASVDSYKAPIDEPVIDYLAKDFDSFKHVLINAMRERVPNWQPTSEADLDQVLIDLIAADADELSDYQDRVLNEAYFGRARKRVSLARYARLMDYHIHQGNQASTLLALKVKDNVNEVDVPEGFGVWTGEKWQNSNAVIFSGIHKQKCYRNLNELVLYTWGGMVTALEAGTTEADIISAKSVQSDGTIISTQTDAENLRDMLLRIGMTKEFRDSLRENEAFALIIEENLNPETGAKNGRDKTARQLLRLIDGNKAVELVNDPINNTWMVRVRWRQEDRLRRRYCFITDCENQPIVEGISKFHGNLIKVAHGRPCLTVFLPPGTALDPPINNQFVHIDETHYEETKWGTVCRLPHKLLAYKATEPGGEERTYSTLAVYVSGVNSAWEERVDFIESSADDYHFIVETDELGNSTIRFGNNVNGHALPDDARVGCYYQIGRGSDGNVGADTLTGFDVFVTDINKVRNPLDVTDGRDPEPGEEIIRRVPQAYRTRQLRAVTLEDYVKRAEELEEVSHAFARYAWTGSWRTVRVAIDPKGKTELPEKLREKIANHLDAVRLIGEDLEVHSARYAALDILLRLCVHPDYWPEDLAYELELEFSDGYTSDGRTGFFHPDNWTFGQPLHASQIIGRALSVKGAERVLLLSIRRWYSTTGHYTNTITINPDDLEINEIDTLEVKPYEVIQVANDPNHLQKGRIQFDIVGGRQ